MYCSFLANRCTAKYERIGRMNWKLLEIVANASVFCLLNNISFEFKGEPLQRNKIRICHLRI